MNVTPAPLTHLPQDDTLARFAAGTLEPATRLAVAAHLEAAPASRERVAAFQAAAGALLETLPPADLASDALDRALALLDAPPPPARAAPRPPKARHAATLPPGVSLPRALEGCSVGRWIWLGPGVRWSKIGIPGAPKANVGLVQVAPGRRLPEHGHSDSEITVVLSGAFSDAAGRYGAGEVCEADPDVDHQPVADPVAGCLCIIAMEGPLRFRGLLGAVLRPFTA